MRHQLPGERILDSEPAALIYFSPTGTTREVLEAVAQGLGSPNPEQIDLTPSDAAAGNSIELDGSRLAVIGCPVYAGRVPLEMIARLKRIHGRNTPAVITVVYGNRAYEDALRELKDVVAEAGFLPFAAAAFIGEHSYSTGASPVAAGRPNAEDLRKAGEFGKAVREKLSAGADIIPVAVPGNFPYKERGALAGIAPVTDQSLCTLCGTCASACPTSAITVAAAVLTDAGKCIRCCACTRACPEGARSMQEPRILQLAEQLSKNCSVPKEPETYL